MSTPTDLRPALAILVVGTLAGFLLGRITAPSQSSPSQSTPPKATSKRAGADESKEDDSSDEEEDTQSDLSSFPANSREECKLVLVVRTDLGMTKGKIAAQCSHATLACYKTLSNSAAGQTTLRRWENMGQAKIAVQVKSEEELLVLQAQAMSLGLCARIIRDAGRTQIASGSATVLGVGPGPKSVIDGVTGGLKLL